MAILDSFKKMLRKRHDASIARDQADMAKFLDKCQNFRQLLAANHNALEIMAEMSDAANGLRMVDMNFVRSRSVGAVASVGRMVSALCAMRAGRYDSLRKKLRQIAIDIENDLYGEKKEYDIPPVLSLQQVADRPEIAGAKTSRLAGIGASLGITIPRGFVFTAASFARFLSGNLREEIERLTTMADCSDDQELFRLAADITAAIIAAPVSEELQGSVMQMVADFPPQTLFAVRSSAINEDSAGSSFAGQYTSYLQVAAEDIVTAWKKVIASAWSVEAMTYRYNHGLRDDEVVMCVSVMEMVQAVAGGVLYSADPLGRQNGLFIHATQGLPVAIVDGSCTPEVWHAVDNIATNIEKAEPHKEPFLAQETVLQLARIGNELERHFGLPQDIEWAINEKEEIVLLQSRPLDVEKTAITEWHCDLPQLLQGGKTAAGGVAAGAVVIINDPAELVSFPQGALLVSAQAHPAYAHVLPKAAALITEHGSIAGHLATIAREYRIPAIVGMQGAVSQLQQESGEITVDADRCTLYRGRTEAMPVKETLLFDLEETPVVQSLRKAMQYIITLHLTDAESPDFIPERCTTLHDITRFCHEKSVYEMFFGKNSVPERATRRLFDKVPTQYWVLDLGGGLANSEKGAVDIADVRSKPLNALWQGMHHIGWQGPPPMQAGSFLAVVAQAAANPEFEAANASSMAARNCFLITESYCNLQARFGFHYTTVEGNAGPFADENYVYLQFTGGGADITRKRLRAKLIRNILIRKGFTATAKEDTVFAKMENIDADQVVEGMVVLGYMLVHSRQLDVALDNDAAVKKYENEFLEGIATTLLEWKKQNGGTDETDTGSGDR